MSNRLIYFGVALLALTLPFAAAQPVQAQSVEHSARLFQKLDTNQDGALDRNSEPGAQSNVFDRVDADGDDRVTRAEFNEAADRMFSRLDANEDGLLTVEDGFEG